MKSICIVTPGLNRGGMERVISELSNYCVKNEYKVYVICLLKSDIGYDFDERVKLIFPTYEYSRKFFFKLGVLKYLINQIRVLRPDVVVGFSETFNPLTIIASRLTNTKVFVSDRSNPLRKQNFSNRNLRRYVYPLGDGIIAQTQRAKDIFMERRYNSNIAVLPNPLKKIENLNLNPHLKSIIHVGSLIVRKNQAELVRIFHEINLKDWKLYLVGEGPERENLQILIRNLNLQENIILVGEVHNVDEWLKKGSIFAFVSLAEGFPNALSEAMAFPLACIAYDCPTGIKELISDEENGFIIPLSDFEQYKYKLKRLMTDEDLRMSIMEKSMIIRKEYTIEKIGNYFINTIFSCPTQ